MFSAAPAVAAPAEPVDAEPSVAPSAGAPGSPADAEGGIGLRLLDVPLARAEDPRAQVYIVDHLEPDSAIERRIEVSNSTSERRVVELYAAGASVEQNVFTAFADRGANELSGWTTVDESAVELAPGEIKAVEVTLQVPGDVERGERYAAVFAQTTTRDTGEVNVIQVHRVGIRMYVNVGPGGEPPTDFTIGEVSLADQEPPVVIAQVRNTGERALDMSGELMLSQETGTVTAGPFPAEVGVTILPGHTGRVEVPIPESLPAGEWNASLVLASGTVERTTETSLTLPGPVETASAGFAHPGLVLGALAGMAAALVFWWGIRGRRRVSSAAAGDE
jgi:hypothetical protein